MLATAITLVAAGLGSATMPQLAWADVSDRTLLVDTGAAGSAAADALGSRRILGYVRASRRRSAALEPCSPASGREAEALDVVVRHLRRRAMRALTGIRGTVHNRACG